MKDNKVSIAITAALASATVSTMAVAETPTTAEEQPNFVYIMTDDMGFSDLSCYGGEIPTPNICALADDGIKMTDYYTNPMSAPTRSMLLTGVDNHQAGVGNMVPLMSGNQMGQPGYEGGLNNRVATLPEMLKAGGYNSYMTGKWHLGHSLQSSPKGRGFDKSFSYTGGGVSHFADNLPLNPFEAPFFFYQEDGKKVDTLPADFFSSDFYTTKLMDYIGHEKADQPFFAYLAFTAPHNPLHAPDEWIEKFNDGRYDVGYDKIRQTRLAKTIELGLAPKNTKDVVNNQDYKPWNQLTSEEKKHSAKAMAIYAAMIANMDHNVGRLVQHLKDIGEYDNTVLIYTHDNGTNPKPTSNYTGNVEKFIKQFDNSYDNMGRSGSYISYDAGWAEAGTAPYSYYKTTTGQGGVRVPMIIRGKDVKARKGFTTSGNGHVADIAPTFLELAGVKKPTYRNGIELHDFDGKSWKTFLTGEEKNIRTADDHIAFELNGYKMLVKGDYKLRGMSAKHIRTEGKAWQLFNIKKDASEQVNLAKAEPKKLEELVKLFEAYADDVDLVEKDLSYPTMYHLQTWSIRDGKFSQNPDAKK